VPTALAVPSAAAPERPNLQPDRPSATRSAPAASPAIRTTTSRSGGAQALAASRRETDHLAVELDILPAPLSPVEPLSPVDALGMKRSAQ
jgi:hypothetical protein